MLYKRSFQINKKAQEVAWTNLIGAVVVLVLIVALIYAGTKLFSSVTGGPENAALDSFDGLIIDVNNLVNPPKPDKTQITEEKPVQPAKFIEHNFYLQADYGLLGFDSQLLSETCLKNDNIQNVACLKPPCLCLYDIDKLTKPLRCEPISGVRYISTTQLTDSFNYGQKHAVLPGDNQLVLWSGCGLNIATTLFGTRTLKITKSEPKDGKVDLFFEVLSKSQR